MRSRRTQTCGTLSLAQTFRPINCFHVSGLEVVVITTERESVRFFRDSNNDINNDNNH